MSFFPSPLAARLRPHGLRAQIAFGVAALVAALALTLSLLLGALLAHESRHHSRTDLDAVARNAARTLAEGLQLREREVKILAHSPTLWNEGLGSERVRQVLARSQALSPYSAWIGVVDAGGTVAAASGDRLVGVDVSARPWYQAGREALHVGDVHPAKLLAKMLPPGSDGGPQRFIDFAAPIRRDGRLLGVIGIHGSWDWAHAVVR